MITWRYLLLKSFYTSAKKINCTNKVYVHASKSLGLFTSGKRVSKCFIVNSLYSHDLMYVYVCVCTGPLFNQDKISCLFHINGWFFCSLLPSKHFQIIRMMKKKVRDLGVFTQSELLKWCLSFNTSIDNNQSIISRREQIMSVFGSALMMTRTEWPRSNRPKRKKMLEVWTYVYETNDSEMFCVFVFPSSSLLILFQINYNEQLTISL